MSQRPPAAGGVRPGPARIPSARVAPWRALATALAVVLGVAGAAAGLRAQPTVPPCTDIYTLMPLVTPLQPPNLADPCVLTQTVVPPASGTPFYRWNTEIPLLPAPPAWPYDFGYRSCCWASMVTNNTWDDYSPVFLGHSDWDWADGFTLPRGSRLNINLIATPGAGDFLPPSPTIGGSSVALLPPGADGAPTGWQGASRPVLGGTVDLITGLPLIQVTDLELPFGGATFRLNRTRSGNHAFDTFGSGPQGISSHWQPRAQDKWWDWTGMGWMVGENPILLIDSALPDLVGPNPRTTWLVLDAHHSIPFQQVNLALSGSGVPRLGYEAPPRFRARMSHNGVWGLVAPPGGVGDNIYGWQTPPTQYEVWLYDGLVKYTFVAVRDDVPPKRWGRGYRNGAAGTDFVATSYHDLADYDPSDDPNFPEHDPYLSDNNPGFGIPYYGLCTKIEDRHGHVAEISYCPVTRERNDNPATADCVECQQLCLRKGQISHVRLKTTLAGVETVEWTLVYAHRYFKSDSSPPPGTWPHDPGNDDTQVLVGASAIDRIYVFKGNAFANTQAPPGSICLQIPSSDQPYRTTPTPIEPLAAYNTSNPNALLPTAWVHMIRYHYRPYENVDGPNQNVLRPPPLLVRTTVATRRQATDGTGVPGSERERHTFFRYARDDGTIGDDAGPNITRLERIYTDDDYRRLVSWAANPGPGFTDCPDALAAWAQAITPEKFALADYAQDSTYEGDVACNGTTVDDFASIRLKPRYSTTWRASDGYFPDPSIGISEQPGATARDRVAYLCAA